MIIFYVKDIDFSIKYDSSIKDELKDPTDFDFLQYYQLSIDTSTDEVIFIKKYHQSKKYV